MRPKGFVELGAARRSERTADPNWRQVFPGPVVHSDTHPPAYPICPWEGSHTELRFNYDTLGVAFFINEGGLFLTAAHVVQDHVGSNTPLKVLYPDLAAKLIYPLRVSRLAIHPNLDVAVGFVKVPIEVTLQRVALGDGGIPLGASVRVFGYAHSSFVDLEAESRLLGGSGLPGLTAKIVYAFHLGEVTDHFPKGAGELKGQPSFAHTAETLGGQSGGPVFCEADDLVYGITSRGTALYGLAIDIRALLDWNIPLLGGRTIRHLSEWGLVSLRRART